MNKRLAIRFPYRYSDRLSLKVNRSIRFYVGKSTNVVSICMWWNSISTVFQLFVRSKSEHHAMHQLLCDEYSNQASSSRSHSGVLFPISSQRSRAANYPSTCLRTAEHACCVIAFLPACIVCRSTHRLFQLVKLRVRTWNPVFLRSTSNFVTFKLHVRNVHRRHHFKF